MDSLIKHPKANKKDFSSLPEFKEKNFFFKASISKPEVVKADLNSKVEIGKVANGIFSSKKAARNFIKLGLSPFIRNFSRNIHYVNMGGG